MKIVSFIPIKLNNQRLPGKNTKLLNGKPMCDYLFHMIKNVDIIDEKYVYCSDDSIKEYLPKEIRYLNRDKKLDGFEVKGLEIIEHFVRDVDADIYVLTHVTQPFSTKKSLENAINKVINEGYDSAFSALELRDYCWYKGNTVNYDRKDIVTTQNLEPVYAETGAFYIFKKEVFTKYHQRIGRNPYIQPVSQFEAVDVDTQEDFDFAETVAKYLY
jgi:CMP-N-acetylneuraminic acid synthetase